MPSTTDTATAPTVDAATIDTWAGYLSPSCGRLRWARAADEKWCRAGREAWTQKHARQELANQGLLPNECVEGCNDCRKYLRDTLTPLCVEERNGWKREVERLVAQGYLMPSGTPVATKDGWDYPVGWIVGGAPGFRKASQDVRSPAERARAITGMSVLPKASTVAKLGSLLAAPPAEEVPVTSSTKVMVGLGVGVLLLAGGLWWASARAKKKAKQEE